MLLPALNKARMHARSIKCLSNTKMLGMGYQLYAVDNNDNMLSVYHGVQREGGTGAAGANGQLWVQRIQKYVGVAGIPNSGDWSVIPANYRSNSVFVCPSMGEGNATYTVGTAYYATLVHYGMPIWGISGRNFNIAGGNYTPNYTIGKLSGLKNISKKIVFADSAYSSLYVGGMYWFRQDTLYLSAKTAAVSYISLGTSIDMGRHANIQREFVTNKSYNAKCNVSFADGHSSSLTMLDFLKDAVNVPNYYTLNKSEYFGF
jgi:prepilin-type processing-associated H-X9-DG protein